MFDDGSKVVQQIAAEKRQQQQLVVEMDKVKAAVAAVAKFRKTKDQLGDKFNKLIQYLPENFSNTDQMRLISQQVNASGVELVQVSQGGNGDKFKFYEELLVNVSLRGTYSDLILFLSNLTQLDKVFVVKQMAFSGGGTGDPGTSPLLNFSATLAMYRSRKEGAN
tara:strand:- start:127 stop:621 length:495 start_codon:yes stop_codon:yes gene_type:complete